MNVKNPTLWTVFVPHWAAGALALAALSFTEHDWAVLAIQIAFQVGMLAGSALTLVAEVRRGR